MLMMTTLLPVFTNLPRWRSMLCALVICRFLLIPDGRIR
ncbi:hypothetical protein ACULNC_17890 [Shigella flexneri]